MFFYIIFGSYHPENSTYQNDMVVSLYIFPMCLENKVIYYLESDGCATWKSAFQFNLVKREFDYVWPYRGQEHCGCEELQGLYSIPI